MSVLLLALVPTASAANGNTNGNTTGVARETAAHDALRALSARQPGGAELVLGLLSPLPAGTVVSVAGPSRPAARGLVASSPARTVAVLHAPAWLFYQDLAPFQQYAHAGRVALVDVATGRVSVSGTLAWPPMLGGKLPPFLASPSAYDGSRYRVFYRPYTGSAEFTSADFSRQAAQSARHIGATLDSPGAATVAALLAAQQACTVRISDTVPGSYYDFAQVAQSRAALAYLFSQLGALAPRFASFIYSARSGLSPAAFVAHEIAAHGCKDVLLYMAGAGYTHSTAVNVGMGLRGQTVLHQDVSVAQLRDLVQAHPDVRFELVLDSPQSSGFHALGNMKNVLLVVTPAASGGGSFTYLPNALVGGKLVANDRDPLHLLQLTDRIVFGITTVVFDPNEISQMQALTRAGKLPSALAYLIARAVDRGAPVDYGTSSGVTPPPGVQTNGFPVGPPSSGPPTPPPPPPGPPLLTANPDAYSASANAVLTVSAANGVLANDTDSANDPLSVDELNGAGGTPPLVGRSAQGAAVTLNADGSFIYDPTVSPTLQSFFNGQSTTDTFTYRANDGHGATGTATVTITLAGKAHRAPALSGVEASTVEYDAGAAAAPVTSSLAIGAPDDTNLTGATVKLSSGFVSSEDALGFTNQNGITGSYNAATGVLSLSGTSSVVNYQAALRSVSYRDPDGANPTTGTRTISFQVNDGAASNNLSNIVTRDIQVNPNPPPIAGDDIASTDKNTAIDIPVLANDTDPDGDTLSVASLDTSGTKGLVSINPDGTIHYDPNGQFASLQQGQTATDTFTYQDTDGYHDSGSATVTVTINGLNDPPILSNIESSTLQYDAGTAGVPVTSTLTVSNPHGTTLAGATVAITSGLAATEDSLQFTAQNGITGSYDSTTGVLTLTGTASVADYQAALRSVTYSDPDGTNPTTGLRTVTFQVDDGASSDNLSNAAGRGVQVNPNLPPNAGNVGASTDKHTAIDINVLSSDSDSDGDTLAVTSVNTAGTLGSVSINPNETIHYDPNGKFNGLTAGQTATDTFSYQISDGFSTASATVTVTINGVNDAPVLSNIETTPASYRAQDPAIQVTNTLSVSDDDSTIGGATASITSGFSSGNDVLSFTNQNGITGSYDSSTGVLTLSGTASVADYQTALQSIEFSSSDGSTSPAPRTVTFAVTDSVGATSNTATRTIDVSEAPQPPVAVNQSYTAVGNTTLGVGTTPTGPAATISGSLLNGDSDPSDPSATLSVTGNTTPADGTVTVNPDGTFTYLPAVGFSGTDTFQYTIAGSNAPSKTATATVTITVGPVVWYVDNSNAAPGNGEAGTPFNTLAAANGAAGSNSIIFLYQGSATYAGGVSLKSGEDLFGQPQGLTVDGYPLVAAGGSSPTITNSGGDGIDLAENSDVEGVNVSSPSGDGIAATSVNDATVGGATPVSISGAGGDGIHIAGGSGTLDFAGASVSASTGHSVLVSSRAGGTATFGGTISDTHSGISLSSNSGSTITFEGKITASTGANSAFSATGGGTVNATGTGSTLTTTTATALNVSNTTIGSSGLTFQSISSDGGDPGISLSSTGSSGGLTVTGTGTAGSGGTIQQSAGDGISLSSTARPSFTDMLIENNGNTSPGGGGITGSSVNGLTLSGSTVSGNGTAANLSGQNNPSPDNDGLDFLGGLTGTVTISNSAVTNSADNGLQITDSSGSLNLTITGSTFSGGGSGLTNNVDPLLGDGVEVLASGPTDATVSVTGSTFTNNPGYQFGFQPSTSSTGTGSGTNSITFDSNVLSNSTGLGNGGDVNIQADGSSTNSVDVKSNTIQGARSNAISLYNDGTTQLSGTVDANTVGNPAVSCSGSVGGDDVAATTRGSATTTLAITNNKLYQYNNATGIGAVNDEGSGTMNLTITGNTVADPVPATVTCPTLGGPAGALWGLWVVSGAQTNDTSVTCADITGNSMTGSAPSAADGGISDFELDEDTAGIFKLPGYTGGGEDSNAVVNFIAGNNTSGGPPSGGTFINGGSGPTQNIFFGASSCPTPPS